MMNRKTALAVMLGLSALAFNASAHGPSKAQYGGVVQTASDLSFELANEGDKAALYIVDHDAPADASKMSGKLAILNGTEKSEVAGTSNPGARWVAKSSNRSGPIALAADTSASLT